MPDDSSKQRTGRRFTEEFKRDAAASVLDTGRPIAHVAKELGVHDSSLGIWVTAERRRRGQSEDGPTPDQLGRLKEREAEAQAPLRSHSRLARTLSSELASRTAMRRYWTVAAALLAGFTVLFVVVEALDIPLLTDPRPWLEGPAAAVGVGLLVADVVLPVPSSIVMIAHGAAFGILMGTALSVAGSVGAALLGFGLGRRGGWLLDQLVPPHERVRADALLSRWGVLAVVVTRPVPLLAETTVILAGASPLGWPSTAVAALVGSIPAAVVYALAGSAGAQAGLTVVFMLVLLVAAATWGAGWLTGRWRSARSAQGDAA